MTIILGTIGSPVVDAMTVPAIRTYGAGDDRMKTSPAATKPAVRP